MLPPYLSSCLDHVHNLWLEFEPSRERSRRVATELLTALAGRIPGLRGLHLECRGEKPLFDAGRDVLDAVHAICRAAPALRHLDLRRLPFTLDDALVLQVARGCPELRSLFLNNSTLVGSVGPGSSLVCMGSWVLVSDFPDLARPWRVRDQPSRCSRLPDAGRGRPSCWPGRRGRVCSHGGRGGGSVLRLTGWLLIAHLFAQFVSVSFFYLSRNCPGFSLTRVMGTPTSVTMGGRGGVLAPTSHTPQADGHSTVDSRSLSSPGRVPRSEGVRCPRRLPQKDGGGRCCAP